MLLTPLGADQPANADRVVTFGAGPALDAAAARPAHVREAVSELLAAPHHRQAAESLRAELAALPGPEHAVALPTQLVRA